MHVSSMEPSVTGNGSVCVCVCACWSVRLFVCLSFACFEEERGVERMRQCEGSHCTVREKEAFAYERV